MSRTTRLNVAVTANTAQFDRQMAKVRAKMKATQQGLSGGAGGALSAAGIGGGFGAGAGMLLRGSPLFAAIGGLTMALEANRRQTEQGKKDVQEMAQLALSPARQQQAKFAAQLLGGEERTANDLMQTRAAFDERLMDRSKRRELAGLGITDEMLNALNSSDIGNFTESLVEISKGMSEMQRLAVGSALGGKAGEMFMQAGQFQAAGDISRAVGAIGMEEAARAVSLEQQRQADMMTNADAQGQVGFFAGLWDLLTGQSAKTEQMQTKIAQELERQTQLMGQPTGPGI